MHFLKHFEYFYFEIIKRYCKNNAQSSYVPDTQFPPSDYKETDIGAIN